MSKTLLAVTTFALFNGFRVNAQSNLNYSYIGGIPLRTPGKCPAGSVSGQITFQQNCCGAGQTFLKDEGSACCPNSTDCYNEVIAAPKCADPSWQLCGGNDGGFCCEQNWICWSEPVVVSGVTGAGVGCSTPGATLTKGQTAVTTIYAANFGPGVSTNTPFSATSSNSSGSQATPTGNNSSASQSSAANTSPSTTGSPGSPNSLTSQSTPTSSSSPSLIPNTSPGGSQVPSLGSTTTKKSSSIGGGAIAGIAIGALALLIAAFAGGIWLTKRRHNTNPSGAPMLEDTKTLPSAFNMNTASRGGSKAQGHVDELGGKGSYVPVSELPTNHQQLVEMYAPHHTG